MGAKSKLFFLHNQIYNVEITVGWVDIGIGTKGKRGFVVSLAKVWEIAKKCLKSIDVYCRLHDF
jgi:hypothetical protein